MKRGDIVLVNLPQTADGAGHEQVGTRPALVVHDDSTLFGSDDRAVHE